MSAADDVMEMQSLVGFIADRLSPSKKDKDRTKAIYDALNSHREELISWNRCFEFLKGKARLVQSWEKDLARQKQQALRDAAERQRTAAHLAWLRSIHEGAAASGADMDRADLAALERVLSRVGALDSALGIPSTTDADETADQSHWGR